MSTSIFIDQTVTKSEKYVQLLPQIKALMGHENDLIANLANIAAALKHGMNFFWVGFYHVKQHDLVLGPFQGDVACTRIAFNAGVCGVAYTQRKSIIVPNVDEFEGHIACSTDSKSEIVIPVFSGGRVVLLLDVDSDQWNDFDQTDEKYLQELAQMISVIYVNSQI